VSNRASAILLVEDEPATPSWCAGPSPRGRPGAPVGGGTLDEARAILRDSETAIDLVIADWRLPDGEGLDLIRDGAALRDRP